MSQPNYKRSTGEHLRQIGRDPKMSDEEHRAFVEKIRKYNSGLDTVSPYPPVRRQPQDSDSPVGSPGASRGDSSE